MREGRLFRGDNRPKGSRAVSDGTSPAGSYAFAVCLSHDVDRVYKSYQYAYESLVNQDFSITGVLSSNNPWWQFPRILEIEERLGVRSSFHFLVEQSIWDRPLRELFSINSWNLFGGRYRVDDLKIASTIRLLDRLGWEIGLHGSYESATDRPRLEAEKSTIESVVNGRVDGNRQHYLNLERPRTWEHLREIGIKYDLSLASRDTIRNQEGYELIRPFDDEFVVFPWSVMDMTAMSTGDTIDEVWERCLSLLAEAKRQRTVLVLDWHQRVFHRDDFPGWADIYGRLIEQALAMGAWVGPPGEFYAAIDHPLGTVDHTLEALEDPLQDRSQHVYPSTA